MIKLQRCLSVLWLCFSSISLLKQKPLAECVVYLARAPKSIEAYAAYTRAKSCIHDHQGPLPPVPLHLRNASTKLMKTLGTWMYINIYLVSYILVQNY